MNSTYPRPYRHAALKSGAVQYEFRLEDFSDQRNDGSYYVKGGVAWPILNETTGVATGCIIVGAQRLSTKKLIIFAEREFICIDHHLNENGSIKIEGIAPFVNWAWAKMRCNVYARSQDDYTNKQWVTQIMRSNMIDPQPQFQHVVVGDQNDAVNILYEMRQTDSLKIHPDSKLVKDLNLWEGAARKVMLPSVLALLSLVFAMRKYPFQSMEDE
jgi:hypothetical protein